MTDINIPNQCANGTTPESVTDSFKFTTTKEGYAPGYVVAESGVWRFNGSILLPNAAEDFEAMSPRLSGASTNQDPGIAAAGSIETDFALDGLKSIAVEFAATRENTPANVVFKLNVFVSVDDGNIWTLLGSGTGKKGERTTLNFNSDIPTGKKVKLRFSNASTYSNTQTGNSINILKIQFKKA